MRIIELRDLVNATYYRRPGPDGKLPEVPKGTPFDEDSMIRQMFSYRDTIAVILKTPENAAKGAQIDEVRQSIKVLDILDAAKGKKFSIEDDLYAYLKRRVDNADWLLINANVIQFVDDIDHAPAVSKERLDKVIEDSDKVDITRAADVGIEGSRPVSINKRKRA